MEMLSLDLLTTKQKFVLHTQLRDTRNLQFLATRNSKNVNRPYVKPATWGQHKKLNAQLLANVLANNLLI